MKKTILFFLITGLPSICLALQPASNLEDTDHGGTDWTLSSSTEIAGRHYNLGWFKINAGVTVTVHGSTVTTAPWTGTRFGNLEINASTIEIVGTLSGDNSGFLGGNWIQFSSGMGRGPGGGMNETNINSSGSGGGHGGTGGLAASNTGSPGAIYGSSVLVSTPPDSLSALPGSGGEGNYANTHNDFGGNGGAAIVLIASSVVATNGTVSANGGVGTSAAGSAEQPGAGGSGGTILVDAFNIVGGSFTANGGAGGTGGNGGSSGPGAGGGGGGRVKFFYGNINISSVNVIGGAGGAGTTPGKNGNLGSIYNSQKAGMPSLLSPLNNMTTNQIFKFNWTTSTDTDGDPVTYQLQVSTSLTFAPLFIATNPPATVYTATVAIAANTTYYWRVRAFDMESYTPWTAPWAVTLDSVAPVSNGIDSITLYLTSVTINLSLATDPQSGLNAQPYNVDVSSAASFVFITTGTLWQASTTFTTTVLDTNVTYYARVQLRDVAGNVSQYSTFTFVTLAKPPEGIFVSSVNPSSINVGWTVSFPTNPAGTNYVAQMSSTNFTAGTLFSSQTIRVASAAIVTGLSPNTTYSIRVLALNWAGASSTTTIASTATLTNFPGIIGYNVFATSLSVILSGNSAGTSIAVTTGTGGNEFTATTSSVGVQDAGNTTLILTNLIPNSAYTVKTRAVNYGNIASSSSLVTSSTTLAAPPGVTGFQVFTTSIAVTLNANGNPIGTQIMVATGTGGNFNVANSSVGLIAGTNTTLTLLGLSPNTLYGIQAGAVDSSVTASTQSTLVTAATTTLAVTPSVAGFQVFTTSISVTLNANTNPIGTRIVVATGTNGDFSIANSSIGVLDSTVTTLSLFGLSTNTAYGIQAGALNPTGSTNAISVTASTVTLAVPPSVTGFQVFTTSIAVTLGLNTNPAGTTLAVTTGNFAVTNSSSGLGTVFVLSGLSPNTTYSVLARAVNANGVPTNSATVTVGTTTLAGALTVSGFQIFATSVAITIGSNSNPVGTQIAIATGTGGNFAVVRSSIGVVTGANTSLVINGLTPNTTYAFQAGSLNPTGSTNTVSVAAGTAAIAAPATGFSVNYLSAYALIFSWAPNNNPSGTSYRAELSTASDFSVKTTSLTLPQSAAFQNLNPKTTYYYRVSAINQNAAEEIAPTISTMTQPVFSISGNVVDPSSVGVASVRIDLAGSATAFVMTTSTGFFQFNTLVSTGIYTIVPSSFSYYSFSPSSRTFSSLSADQQGQGFVRTSSIPTLTFTGELGYTNNGVYPTAGSHNTNFVFRVNYTDPNNDAPKAGYPKVHIRTSTGAGGAGDIPIVGSPFTMSEADVTDTNYRDGKIYTFSTNQISTGTYSHFFEAFNVFGATAPALTVFGNPVLGNNPVLSFTGETNYGSSALYPLTGTSTSTFMFRINYTDADNDAPKAGYPGIRLFKSGTEIPGSPITMSAVDTTDSIYSDGKLYFYQMTLSTGLYTYSIEAQDFFGAIASTITGVGPDITLSVSGYVLDPSSAPLASVKVSLTGAATGTVVTDSSGFFQFNGLSAGNNYSVAVSSSAFYSFNPTTRSYLNLQTHQTNQYFVRLNTAPAIYWTSETNYEANGLNPEIGMTTTSFVFHVFYQDGDNDPPKAGYPKLYVRRGSLSVSSSPFTMNYLSGSASTGAVYSVSLKFDVLSTSYTYFFEAFDAFGSSASWGVAGSSVVVSSITAAFTVFANPPSSIDNPASGAAGPGGGTPDGATVPSTQVMLTWAATDPSGNPLDFNLFLSNPTKLTPAAGRALYYAGDLDLNKIYSGRDTSFVLKNLSPGKTYFWRVDATNIFGVTTSGKLFSFKTLDIPIDKSFNFPNPFNPNRQNTTIAFKVSDDQPVGIKIFSEMGDLVYETTTNATAGTNLFVWDGRDNNGNVLFNGSYVCTIRSKEGIAKSIILVVK